MSHDPLEFLGWTPPNENWVKLPKDLIALMPLMKESELKVTLYILTHTWGFQNYDGYQFMTRDEIMNGRRTKGGGRLDNGTGLSKQSVITGTKSGIARGTLEELEVRKDKARIRKGYRLKHRKEGSKIWTPGVKNLDLDLNKETSERSSSSQPKAEEPAKPKRKRKATKRDTFNTAMELAFSQATKLHGQGIALPKRITVADAKTANLRWQQPLWNLYYLFMPDDVRAGDTPLIYEEEILELTIELVGLAVAKAKQEGLTMDAPAAIEKIAVSIHSDGYAGVQSASNFWDSQKPKVVK